MPKLNSIESWVEALDFLLVDPERVTWPAPARVTFINLALSQLREARPDVFTEIIEIPLVPGTRQVMPEGVTAVVGKPSTLCLNESGEVVAGGSADQIDEDEVKAFASFPACKPTSGSTGAGGVARAAGAVTITTKCSTWGLQGFQFSPASPRTFSVLPAVPVGVTPVITVEAQTCAPQYEWPADKDKVVACRLRAELLEAILYYAYQTPQESELALNRANQHMQRLTQMLGLNYRMQSRHASGYWLGRTPTGDSDPQVQR